MIMHVCYECSKASFSVFQCLTASDTIDVFGSRERESFFCWFPYMVLIKWGKIITANPTNRKRSLTRVAFVRYEICIVRYSSTFSPPTLLKFWLDTGCSTTDVANHSYVPTLCASWDDGSSGLITSPTTHTLIRICMHVLQTAALEMASILF